MKWTLCTHDLPTRTYTGHYSMKSIILGTLSISVSTFIDDKHLFVSCRAIVPDDF